VNKTKLQSGSAYLAIVIILSVALIGALGFAFWQNTNKPADVANALKPVGSNSIDDSEAAIMVGNFYSEYNAVWNNPTATGSEGSKLIDNAHALVANYATSNFLTEYDKPRNMDNVVCAQQFVGAQKIIDHKADGNIAEVTVRETFVYSGNHDIKVKVVDQDGLKIDSINCPSTN
jgi:hypothetical protein